MSRKSLDTTFDFLRSLNRSVSADDVHRLLQKRLGQYGIESYMAGAVRGNQVNPRDQLSQALLDTMPIEWKRHYMTRGYMLKDPTIRHLGLTQVPFRWDEALAPCAADDSGRRVLLEAGEFGLGQGFTVPLMTLDNELAGFSFSGPRIEISPSERDTLHVVATYAFAQLLLIRQSARNLSVVRLAPREREALQWTAEGKTAWEVGELMGISEKGVEYHLKSVRTKLGAMNSVQSVTIALRHGLIS